MGNLCDKIIRLIDEGRWGLTWHANDSIQERGVEIWHIAGLSPDGKVLREAPDAKPRPKIEVEIMLPDGTLAKVIWGYDACLDRAVLITVHFFDGPRP